MKKTLLTMFAATMMAQGALAQVFTIGNGGAELADGTSITVTESEDDGFETTMPSKLWVKNNTASSKTFAVEYTVEQIDNGRMQICFPEQCMAKMKAGTFSTAECTLAAGESRNLLTEWFPATDGVCRIKYAIANGGYSVTVNYAYGTAHIDSAAEDEDAETLYYDLSGRRTTQPAHGLYIKKSVAKNGKTATRKVFLN